VYGIISGIEFFGKRDLFIKDYQDQLNISTSGWKKAIANADNVVKNASNRLRDYVGYTSEEFIALDYGFLVGSDRRDLWFADELMDEWLSLQAKYEEYKEKIWQILQNVNALNMCSNRVSGINIGGVSIQQEMNCIQSIGEQAEEAIAAAEAAKQETKLSDSVKTVSPTATATAVKPVVSAGSTNATTSLPVNTTTSTTTPVVVDATATSAATETSSTKTQIIIIILISVIGLIIFGSLYYYMKLKQKRAKRKKAIEKNKIADETTS
jgi:hypothetical protein